ncbi:BnaA05g15810D [Brassica napus]|uniref:BnaA05g15810D protein n=1 Tax=Brassica napus TaxID=3708 RepID=A0A078GWT1_BRANA|nr:BnaA05g15810D [Brassica napus]
MQEDCSMNFIKKIQMQQQNSLEEKQYFLVVIFDTFFQTYHKAGGNKLLWQQSTVSVTA